MNVNVKIFQPTETRIETAPNYSQPAMTIHFVASSVDFPENYMDSITLLKINATILNAKAAIKAKILAHIKQNVIPWQEYQETI